MRFRFIAQQRKAYPVALMCRLLGVSTAGFYDYLRRAERPDDPDRLKLLGWIKQLAQASKNTYGSRRMSQGLRALFLCDTSPVSNHFCRESFISIQDSFGTCSKIGLPRISDFA